MIPQRQMIILQGQVHAVQRHVEDLDRGRRHSTSKSHGEIDMDNDHHVSPWLMMVIIG